MPRLKYDCLRCVGYCCSIYERVQVKPKDVRRLAKYFGITPELATRRYTRIHPGSKERVLKRTPDSVFEEACMFLDRDKRVCTIYEGRPDVCRAWPGPVSNCVYFDMLEFERKQQDNDTIVPVVQLTFPEMPEPTVDPL